MPPCSPPLCTPAPPLWPLYPLARCPGPDALIYPSTLVLPHPTALIYPSTLVLLPSRRAAEDGCEDVNMRGVNGVSAAESIQCYSHDHDSLH